MISWLSNGHLALLFVVADIGVEAQGEQGDGNVQAAVGAAEVEGLGEQALLGEPSVGQDVHQLVLGEEGEVGL